MRVMSSCGSEMSRSCSGSTKAKKSIVATPAAKNDGHRIAPMRCAIGRGGWSKLGAALACATCEGSEGRPGTSVRRVGHRRVGRASLGGVGERPDVGADQARARLAEDLPVRRHVAVMPLLDRRDDVLDVIAVQPVVV